MENYVIALCEDESKEPTKIVKTGYNYIALAEEDLRTLFKEDDDTRKINFASIQRNSGEQNAEFKTYHRSDFNLKISLYSQDRELLGYADTNSLFVKDAELKLIELMQENPQISFGYIESDKGTFDQAKHFLNKSILAEKYQGAFDEKNITLEKPKYLTLEQFQEAKERGILNQRITLYKTTNDLKNFDIIYLDTAQYHHAEREILERMQKDGTIAYATTDLGGNIAKVDREFFTKKFENCFDEINKKIEKELIGLMKDFVTASRKAREQVKSRDDKGRILEFKDNKIAEKILEDKYYALHKMYKKFKENEILKNPYFVKKYELNEQNDISNYEKLESKLIDKAREELFKEKLFKEYSNGTLKLAEKIKDYEKKFSVLLPEAKARKHNEIIKDSINLQNIYVNCEPYFANINQSHLAKAEQTIAKFFQNNNRTQSKANTR